MLLDKMRLGVVSKVLSWLIVCVEVIGVVIFLVSSYVNEIEVILM